MGKGREQEYGKKDGGEMGEGGRGRREGVWRKEFPLWAEFKGEGTVFTLQVGKKGFFPRKAVLERPPSGTAAHRQ